MTRPGAAGPLAALAVLAAIAAGWWLLRGGGPPPHPVTIVRPPPVLPRAEEPPALKPPHRAAAAPNAGKTAVSRRVVESDPEDESTPEPPKDRPANPEIWARLRLLEAGTGKPIPADADPAVTLSVHRGWRVDLIPQRVFREEDGRLAVAPQPGAESSLTEAEIASARYEIAAYGYAARGGLAKADLAGEHDIELKPVAPSVVGVLAAGPGVVAGKVKTEIRRADGQPLAPGPRPLRLPRALGPFAIHDLPQGKWRLNAWTFQLGNLTARGSAEFEKAESTVDLGTIEIRGYSSIRARLVAADGTPILVPGLEVSRPGVEVGEVQDVEREVDDEGWTEFHGLEPGEEFIVRSPTFEVEETVRAPAAGDPPLKVELRKDVRLVRCRLRFTVDGKDPAQWGDWLGGPRILDGAWKGDGTLEHDMIPGRYTLAILARPAGADAMRRVDATFTVPDQPAWDATVDLKEER